MMRREEGKKCGSLSTFNGGGGGGGGEHNIQDESVMLSSAASGDVPNLTSRKEREMRGGSSTPGQFKGKEKNPASRVRKFEQTKRRMHLYRLGVERVIPMEKMLKKTRS